MELAQLKARIEAARRFDHEVGGVRFALQVPTEYEITVYCARARADGATDPSSMMVEAMRAMLLSAVRGWSGVTVDHFLRDGDTEPVEFEPGLVAPLFDAQPDLAPPIVTELQRRLVVRKERTESAAKN
jgi:hypothetical protein